VLFVTVTVLKTGHSSRSRNQIMKCDLDTAVPDWVIEHPDALAVFESLGIDYCCGGKSLAAACRERGLDAVVVLKKLQAIIEEHHDGKDSLA